MEFKKKKSLFPQLYSQSTNENQAGELLLQNPLLAYDLFRILFQLDLVDENILKVN